MTKFVAFLRGINVGGHRKVPMAQLREICPGSHVRSYIASGNLMFEAEGTALEHQQTLSASISETFGFDVPVLVLDDARLRDMLARCPYPPDSGKAVHGFLCLSDPVIDRSLIENLKSPTEDVTAVGQTVWLHAPDGIGRSRLAVRLEKAIAGTEVTARNLNTLTRMVEMLDEAPPAC